MRPACVRPVFYRISVSLVFSFCFHACTHEPFPEPVPETEHGPEEGDTNLLPSDTAAMDRGACHPDTVHFNRDVMPILRTNCALTGCHSVDHATGNVVLDNYLNTFNTGDVRPGDPDASGLFEVITETDEDKRMPPAASGFEALDAAEIGLIETWIGQGAQNLTCTEASDTAGNDTIAIPSFMTEVAPIMQAKCANPGCHEADNDPRVPLTTHSEIKVAIGLFSMKSRIVNGSMPAEGALTPQEYNTLINWIEAGAPNN